MAHYDHRKNPNSHLSFYLFDDLRHQQNHKKHPRKEIEFHRYDTLEEAVEKLKETPAYMTPALGMQRGLGELDLVHRREGEYNLVTDYQNIPSWRNDQSVLSAIKEVCELLPIQWQFHSGPFDSSILIPLDLDDITKGFLPDTYFWNKNLRVDLAESLVNCSPYKAINEVFCPGEGWLEYQSARKIADRFGYNDPHCLKVARYNITYAETKKPWNTGQADISPKDLDLLLERWYLREGSALQAQKAENRLCTAISEAIYGYEEDAVSRQSHLEALKDDFYKGNYEIIDKALTKAPAETTLQQNKIYELRFRLSALAESDRRPKLEETIESAKTRENSSHSSHLGSQLNR